MEEKEVGVITHYFGKVGVGMIQLTDSIKVGDTIHIKGHGYDFTQQVGSMQIDYKNIETAAVGQEVGLKVDQKVHPNDKVYKVVA
ncbi:MAG: hypothetical protein HY590_03455 [Candidatus Omnitrophica bacterium]|nr:hypothetical protein [Candidatus Omnitrophota bacterium]